MDDTNKLSEEAERARFEAAAELSESERKKVGPHYLDMDVELFWRGWCLAKADTPPVALPAVVDAEAVAWMQIGKGLNAGTRIPRAYKPKKWNPDWWDFKPLYFDSKDAKELS